MRFLRIRCLRRAMSWRRLIMCVVPLSITAIMLSANWLVVWNPSNVVAPPRVAMREIYKDSFGNVLQVQGNIMELSKDYSELNQKTRQMRTTNRQKKKRKSMSRGNKLRKEVNMQPKRTLQEKKEVDAPRSRLGPEKHAQFPNLSRVFLETERTRLKGSSVCGKGWQDNYIKLHRMILKSKAPRKFLVYTCKGEGYGCAGYGNRLGGITALFLLAVLTDRALLIDWDYKKSLAIRNFFRPNKIKWDYSVSNLQGLDFRMHYWGKGFPKNLRNVTLERPGNIHPEFSSWFLKTDIEKYLEYPVERVTAVWNFAHEIWGNPFLARKAAEKGLILPTQRYSTVGCAYELLFQTAPEFEKRLFYARDILERRANTPVIGLHVRMGDSVFGRRHRYNTQNYKSFFTCAQTVEKEITKSRPQIKASDIRWFLATDSAAIKDYAKTEYPNKVSTLDMVPEHIGIFQKQRLPSVEGMYGVLLDHFLLSECDYLILSNSTFGFTALGRTLHSPGSFTYGERCGAAVRQPRYKTWNV